MEKEALRGSVSQADNPVVLTKYCQYCDKNLPHSCFTVRRASRDGMSTKCRECGHKYAAARYLSLREVSERVKQKAKKWAAANKERRLEIVRKSAEKHREKKNKQSSEYQKKMRVLFPEKYRLQGKISAHNRRIRIAACGKMPSANIVGMILEMARGRCVYCGKNGVKLTIDHATAVNDGGKNTWDNLIPCCKSCNSSKNDGDIADWLYNRHGAKGLAEALLFMKAVRKAVRRLYPELYEDFCQRYIDDLNKANDEAG